MVGSTSRPTRKLRSRTNGAKADWDVHKIKLVRGGLAVQTGSDLTVTVNRPTTNVSVEISDKSDARVQVAWNGGVVHTFTGVATIVVNTRNARNDQVP